MTLTLADHLFVVLLALAFPLYEFFAIPKKVARVRAGETGLRMRFYRGVIRDEWIWSVVVIGTWFFLGRSAAGLGLVPNGGPLAWAGYTLTAAICVLLVLQARSILANEARRKAMIGEIGSIAALMPHTKAERRGFDLVSITAGICEELLFRGFLTAYLMTLLGAPFWAAAIGSSILFGVAHMYQGPRGIVRTGAVGLMLALLYGMTGSLWAPMLAHAVMDITSGRIAFGSFREDRPEGSRRDLAA